MNIIDPSNKDIHVQVGDEYGILKRPAYAFRPMAYEDTLLYESENDETQYEL